LHIFLSLIDLNTFFVLEKEAIHLFLSIQAEHGANEGISSGLADAYHELAFQTLADQVKISVRSKAGNRWMFRISHPSDQPLKIVPALLQKDSATGLYPCLHETTPVRMDLSHSGWSDIFFLGMDYPEGAKVLNISVDLCILNSQTSAQPKPPIETWFRVIDEPVLRLTSIDLSTHADINDLNEVFDFAKDYPEEQYRLQLLLLSAIPGNLLQNRILRSDH
jgi:hypothetical protein